MSDVSDSRVVGALRFIDATTGAWIKDPLSPSSDGVRFARNRRGAYAIVSAAGLEDHLEAFDAPPATPPLGQLPFVVTIEDPSGRYLSRTTTIHLPRDPDPDDVTDPESLFQPILVPLFPSPIAPISPGWAVVRASVRAPDGTGLAGAYLRLRRTSQPTTDDPPLARGLADGRGQALIAVSGIPVTSWDSDDGGPVLSSEIEATLEAYFDPDGASPPDPDVLDSRRLLPPADPDALARATVNVRLASGREIAVPVEITP